MGVVDYPFYSNVYMGTDADNASFPALCARASDVIGALTKWAVDETTISNYPACIQNLYRKAVCAQIDFFAINGTDSVNDSGNGEVAWKRGAPVPIKDVTDLTRLSESKIFCMESATLCVSSREFPPSRYISTANISRAARGII